VVIGKDTRRSSYMFEYALAAGLTASGADAYLLHVTTTPSVAYVTRMDDFDCGVMISASHNPFHDNGIKLINRNGEKMEEATIDLLEAYLDGKLELYGKTWPTLPYAHRADIGCTVDYVSGRNRYIGYLISLGMYSFKGMKVGLDCANGAAWNMARLVFDALGAKTYLLGNDPDGTNINENAGSTHIEVLQKFVVDNGLDVGFAFDGDADRCLCVDEKGNVVSGDHILYILGKYMRSMGRLDNNTVVTTVMSNFGLYKAFDECGISYAKTAVGDKYVYEYMTANGCRLGGEQSGHIIISNYATTGDGILTSLKIMEVMLAKKKRLSELCQGLTIYPQVLKNVRVHSKPEARNDPAVQAAVEEVAAQLGQTGRILVRESGTEPVIRVMVEAPTKLQCQEMVDRVVDVICARGHSRV
jgi:phosphoglucosamine mutase